MSSCVVLPTSAAPAPVAIRSPRVVSARAPLDLELFRMLVDLRALDPEMFELIREEVAFFGARAKRRNGTGP